MERADCMVKALAILTGLPYSTVLEALNEQGRKPRRGTHWHTTHRALRTLGFKLEPLPTDAMQAIIDRYPGVHSKCKNITTHHPRRFAKVWKDIEPLLFDMRHHVAAFKDGELHDHTVNNARRVIGLYRVVPIKAETPAEPLKPTLEEIAVEGDAEPGWATEYFGLTPALRARKENE
jgi:hypothetical protein